METKIYSKKRLSVLVAFLMVAMNLLAQSAPVTSVGPESFSAGVYTIPINVTGFTNVGDISMKLKYDNTKLSYAGVVVNHSLATATTVIEQSPLTDQSGTFSFSATSKTAYNLGSPDGTLLSISFAVQTGVSNVTTPLTWSTKQGDNDMTPPAPNVFDVPITPSNLSSFFLPGDVTIATIPVITGPTQACTGSTTSVYTTDPGMTLYNWTVSAGGSITAGQGTRSITVTWSTDGNKTVSVSFTDPVDGMVTSVPYPVLVYLPVPTITGPIDPTSLLPATLGNGSTPGQTYTTETGMTGYLWTTSPAGAIKTGQGTASITVDWTNPVGQQTVSVTYTDPLGCNPLTPTVLIINYYPFAGPIDPTTIKQFVDPLPHFAAGLRINAKAGGALLIKTVPVQQVALSTGTVTTTGTIGDPSTPNAGKGNYAAYVVSKDNGATWGVPMWPAQTIEAQQGHQLTVQYRNDLFGQTYDNFNILADQTLLMNGYTPNGNIMTDPYRGDIPMVVHLHGGEMPSNSDGGPTAWFTPGYNKLGPGFAFNASSLATYPNQQEAATLWYHPHDQGLTRINVYTGLAGFYFLRGATEEADHLPGWSGDDKVVEGTPAGKQPTFNGTNAYLPEIEVAIQDRMFNVKGELYWPVAPTNPELHPFWTPEFFGDMFTVNGKAYPYLSVAPRKYRFRMLDGCNARFLNMWLRDTVNKVNGPAITVIGTDGGLLQNPKVIAPGSTLFMGPGERYDVVIDFTGVAPGTSFTLMNDANAPYPTGDPVVKGLTDRIMVFEVTGSMVSAANTENQGSDKSQVPANLRPNDPLVQLSDFNGGLMPDVVPAVKRQLLLNEVSAAGGPAAVMVNNSHFDVATPIAGEPLTFGGPTEIPLEGTTEVFTIINTTVDAHPMHIHLLQWQLVSRQLFDQVGYMNAYTTAWAARNVPEFPAGLGYPGGAGSPNPYNTPNADGAVGGNPAITPFLQGPVIPALPQENGWKDDIIALPGYVMTYVVRVAPTDRAIKATPEQMLFPFDPSLGPGYVWHCHIIDHEDMDMMRPLPIAPSALRFPKITAQPAAQIACVGDNVTFGVTATSTTAISYKWQISTNNGVDFTDLVDGSPYSGVLTASLHVNPADLSLTTNKYRAVLTNVDGQTTSNAALLTVNNCTLSGTLKYNNATLDPIAGFVVTANGKTATTDATGAFTITGITSGAHAVTVNVGGKAVGAINSTDAGLANYWFSTPTAIPFVKFLAGDVNNDASVSPIDAQRIQKYFVLDLAFSKAPWVFHNATGTGTNNPPAFTATINGVSVANFNILAMATGDFNGSFMPNAPAKGGPVSILRLLDGETRKVAANTKFELPIRATSDMEVGAISLILNLSSDMVDVQSVTVKGSTVPATFNVKDNQLRIGWNSLVPVNVKADGDLIILKLKSSAAFADGEIFQINAEESSLNELATGKFSPIDGAVLKADKVLASTILNDSPDGLQFGLYPNPANNQATVNYSIPRDGQVTIQLYNSIGIVVNTVLNEAKTTGKYSVNVDVSAMSHGIYMAKITLHGSGPDMVRTVKFVVNK